MKRTQSILMAALLWCSSAVHAHNYHVGLTEISFNRNSGNTEVVHSYTAHDVEALLMHLHQRHVDLGLEEDQALFRRYLEQQFRITADGKPIGLQWVGMLAKPDIIIVFQEIEKVALPPGVILFDAVLTDFLPQQVNNVNVSGLGRPPATLVFNRYRSEHPLP